QGIIVLTKIDQVFDELLEVVLEDVEETLEQTFLHDAPIYYVDSLSEKGIPLLKKDLQKILKKMIKKDTNKSFRLPIDQVFTVKGLGAIVRGTIYNGEVNLGDRLKILPSNKKVRVRQIERHQKQITSAFRGQ